MQEIDRFTIQDIGIPSMVLMENAARAVAAAIEQAVPGPGSVLALCGAGNNGGDGIAVARILAGRGWPGSVLLVGDPARCSADNLQQQQIARNMGVEFLSEGGTVNFDSYSVVVDALFGIGLDRPIQGKAARHIHALNDARKPYVCAVDIPSGLSADTGEVLGTCVLADATVTFGYPKKGMAVLQGKKWLGILTVADIGFAIRPQVGS
jgi:hydroxyethylthiazole kinase-like uncharacterized protein yjeF